MKKLLTYIVKEITGSENCDIEESVDNDHINFIIKSDPENIGIIIGKGGKTIKSIRNILRVKAVLDKKSVSVSVEEK